MSLELAVTAREAASALKISPRHLWELTHRGEILHVRNGRRIYYRVCDLEAWLESKLMRGSVAMHLAAVETTAINGIGHSAGSRD